jgi:hypothetical protein
MPVIKKEEPPSTGVVEGFTTVVASGVTHRETRLVGKLPFAVPENRLLKVGTVILPL